ncbi:hypothetical protein BpHYR1_043345 [Brachionus plicatilis]|uniref:Uncharacterized protein n=1 Tax=Brachionus plicatilis TaxID=10195 RepID=A0A3M7QBJ1_BRAPC|nr:hypothetical protein BpHYR1_043345 [Brachionus plicatilis]
MKAPKKAILFNEAAASFFGMSFFKSIYRFCPIDKVSTQLVNSIDKAPIENIPDKNRSLNVKIWDLLMKLKIYKFKCFAFLYVNTIRKLRVSQHNIDGAECVKVVFSSTSEKIFNNHSYFLIKAGGNSAERQTSGNKGATKLIGLFLRHSLLRQPYPRPIDLQQYFLAHSKFSHPLAVSLSGPSVILSHISLNSKNKFIPNDVTFTQPDKFKYSKSFSSYFEAKKLD